MDASLESIYSILDQSVDKEDIFAKARQVRAEHFGNEVFAYGFNYFSTYCLNRCSFCHYRSDNKDAVRYRNSAEQVVEDAKLLAESGVHLIDLTMGEDPYYKFQPERFADLIAKVRSATELPIMISPGVVAPESLRLFKQAGAVWFALYQETFVKSFYERLRVNQDFDARIKLKEEAIRIGLLVEEGILTGWGDGVADAVESILQMGKTQPSQVRVMTFVPQKGTPMESLEPQSNERELLMIAAMRLLYPSKLIPASLDVEGPKGLEDRLNAGANVITSLIPPESGLVGVASRSDIDDGGRSLPQVRPILERMGLKLASQSCYEAYIEAALEEHVYFGRTSAQELFPTYVAAE
ncbi:MAG: methylornithine synthase PylB [Coriobacteriia bacterium]|nr:methylornithine synthase PylB [Coriobacteriia bacterium]